MASSGMGGDMGMNMTMAPPPSSSGMVPGGGGMMHMTFFWGKRVQVLFSGWPGDSGLAMYLLALLVVLLAAAFLECLSLGSRSLARPADDSRRLTTALLLTALHAARMGLAYLVMLAVMSFNVGVLIAAIAGHALGFLVSGSGLLKRSQAHNEAQPNGASYVMASSAKC